MKQPVLRPGDVHIVANLASRLAKCFASGEQRPRWTIPCRGEGIDGPGYNPDVWGGDTPPGLYRITHKERIPATDADGAAFGLLYFWMEEQEGQESSRGRAGIGWHGGGSRLLDPWAPLQGWQVTHGCLRSQNQDLERVEQTVDFVLKNGGRVWLTVVPPGGKL